MHGQDYSDELHTVTDFCKSDFDPAQLGIKLQLPTVHFETIMKNDQSKVKSKGIVEYFNH